jgi:putative transcriptional regulator
MTQRSQKTVSNSIRALRFQAGEMTQQALADRVGVTRQTIVAIEQGRYAPSLEVAFRISEVFDLGLEQVFHYSRGQSSDETGSS